VGARLGRVVGAAVVGYPLGAAVVGLAVVGANVGVIVGEEVGPCEGA
jgi:hypothetical protein